MGILSDIFHKILPSSNPSATQHSYDTPSSAQSTSAQQGSPGSAQSTSAQAAPGKASSGIPPPTAPMAQVDVEVILNNMAAGQTLNWRTSIVDLLKVLNLDSSLQARKALAAELHYSGDTSDSATMNIWLHREVMNKLAANGGKVPADLRD
jgi:hypothetical protein